MSTSYPYQETLQYVASRCAELFNVNINEPGEPLADPEATLERSDVDPHCAEPQLVALSRIHDGFRLEWSTTDEQKKLGLEDAGIIALQDLDTIYYSWNEEFNVEMYEEDEDEHYQTLAEHLRRFHVVDQFADFAGIVVGIYCDESRNPELYIYTDGGGELPIPLGVDLNGYLELLKLSLGDVYWQLLLVELNQYYSQPQSDAFVIQGINAQDFVSDMTKLNPEFTLEIFMARYDEVRLRR